MSTPVAVYLQDAHPIREAMEIAKYAEAKGFAAVWQAESRLVREATVPMAAFLSVTDADQGRLGRGRLLEPQPGPPGGHVLDARRPRARPGDPRHRGVVGSAGEEGGHRPRPAAHGDARDRHLRARPAAQRDGHLRRRLRAPRRRRARLRVPGPPAEGRADLHRRHGHADDGAHRRDRRRRGAQLPRLPGLQRQGDRGAGARRRPRPAGRSTTSTVRSSSCARCTRTTTPRWTWPG